jgi:hypothetical protein
MVNEKNSGSRLPELAYRNLRFLESADARALRILSEYFDPRAFSLVRRPFRICTKWSFALSKVLGRGCKLN